MVPWTIRLSIAAWSPVHRLGAAHPVGHVGRKLNLAGGLNLIYAAQNGCFLSDMARVARGRRVWEPVDKGLAVATRRVWAMAVSRGGMPLWTDAR